jgi:hypothetical protein
VNKEQIVYTDENGNEYVLDEVGNKMPPLQSGKFIPASKENSGFSHYDSPDHCWFCGKLTCRGNCFK